MMSRAKHAAGQGRRNKFSDTFLGSIVGYESTVSRFQPILALSSQGAMLGVSGTS
jgi:hypothetical protein